MKTVTAPRILVALDFDTSSECLNLVGQLDPKICRLKVGKELFTACGPHLVEKIQDLGFDVFLDLKFHDIPNTVAKAVKAAAGLGVWMVNVHASGGKRMMEAAAESLVSVSKPPLLIAVTILTSMESGDMKAIGINASPEQQVLRLAALTADAGLDGIVCSAQEAPELRRQFGNKLMLVTPGIRPEGSEAGDQRRIVTPVQALADGSDYLVIGRPITQSPNPAAVCRAIAESLQPTVNRV